jgi:dTDP-4-dehydrorhamnose reductase
VKILLIGATGQLGGDLLRNNPGHEIVAPARSQLDLQDVGQIEKAVRDTGPDVVINCAAFHNVPLCEEQPVIVRTCGLYGRSGAASKGGNFVDKRVDDAKHAKRLEMACDQTISPTSTDDLSRAVFRLISHQGIVGGIYHLVNEGHCTWFEFTKAIYEELGIDIEVVPVDRKGMSGQMRRPLYSVLGNDAARAIGISLPSWRDALCRYLKKNHAS